MLQDEPLNNSVTSVLTTPEDIPEGEIILGELSAIDENGQPQVTFSLGKRFGPVTAIATIPLSPQHIGRQLGLLFARDTNKTPVVVGLVHNAFYSILDNIEVADSAEDEEIFQQAHSSRRAPSQSEKDEDNVLVDGKRIVLEGKEEVVLRCGESSITLHKSGKISIRGKYLLNRSSGVNRIMGGSVQVN